MLNFDLHFLFFKFFFIFLIFFYIYIALTKITESNQIFFTIILAESIKICKSFHKSEKHLTAESMEKKTHKRSANQITPNEMSYYGCEYM